MVYLSIRLYTTCIPWYTKLYTWKSLTNTCFLFGFFCLCIPKLKFNVYVCIHQLAWALTRVCIKNTCRCIRCVRIGGESGFA